jgi:TetR/AcrR family transcriptional regulator
MEINMSITDRREREKKQRQHDIINAAEKLFFSKGYDEVSMKDIALEVELSKATLYLYFQNKKSLFFAIVLRGTKILNSIIREAVQKEEMGIDKISAYRAAYNEFTWEYPDYIQIYNYFRSGRFNLEKEDHSNGKRKIKSHQIDSISYVMECENEILKLRKERFSILCNSVQKGLDDGTIRQDLDPVEVAILLSAISKSLSNIPSDHMKALKNRGINCETYFKDVGDLVQHMIMNWKEQD